MEEKYIVGGKGDRYANIFAGLGKIGKSLVKIVARGFECDSLRPGWGLHPIDLFWWWNEACVAEDIRVRLSEFLA